MDELFGMPMDTLMVVFLAGFGLLIAVVTSLAVRNPLLLKLGARNIPRRKERAVLIVIGLMLSTTIITAAFNTGDTMTHTIRTVVLDGLGNADEIVSAREESDIEVTGESVSLEYFDQAAFERIREAVAGSDLVDGVAPLIAETVAIQDLATRQTEPRTNLFATEPDHMGAFGQMTVNGKAVSLVELDPGEVYLNEHAAKELKAEPGHDIQLYTGAQSRSFRVKDVVRFDAGGKNDSAVFMPLTVAQDLLGKKGLIKHVVISNRGDALTGAPLSDQVMSLIQPALSELGLAGEMTKKDDLKEAEDAGSAFTSFFMTFGTFSIIAGIMLIFLIFVMLAAERKSEMGISRAVGAERRHLVQMFMFEGLLYDLLAAAVGVALGLAVAFGMVLVMARASGVLGIEIEHDFRPRSVIVAYTMGVILTFMVVTFSAWRVSVLNIVTAIRNLPEPSLRRGGRGSALLALAFIGLGALMAVSGLNSRDSTPFFLGVSLPIIGLVPLTRWLGVPDRIAYTVPGLLLVAWWLLPPGVMDPILPEMSGDFSIWVTSGVMVVAGATWVVMYNSDRTVGAAMIVMSRFAWLAPVMKTAVSYPLTARFRTGMTLAMFTLVVFTLVVGATITNAFNVAWADLESWSGGYDIRATTVPVAPIRDMETTIASSGALDPAQFRSAGSQSLLGMEARQTGTVRDFEAYPLRGLSDSFLANNTYGFGAKARGYESAREVWDALRADPHLAVVDAIPAPQRSDYDFAVGLPDFRLEGFYLDDGQFDPIPVEVKDPLTGKTVQVTIIGVLRDAAPFFMIGISTSQRLVEEEFPEQAAPGMHFLKLAPGVDPGRAAEDLESVFLANGMEAEVIKDEMDDAVSANRTFVYVIQGFLGLGLVVGVAALAVISARAVVERRHEIGVMRSIGFEQSMVQWSFLLESSMVAFVGILLGSALGLVVAYNVIADAASQPSWDNITFAVPWVNLLIVYAVVISASLVATYFPARQASRVYPAEALRYQ